MVKSEHISTLALVFLFLTLSRPILPGYSRINYFPAWKWCQYSFLWSVTFRVRTPENTDQQKRGVQKLFTQHFCSVFVDKMCYKQ